MSEKIKNPHDRAFKRAMSDIRVARGFLKQFLPKALLAAIDMRTLKLSSNTFVTKDLKEKMSDIVYTVKINSRRAYICLIIEHQSTPEPWMAYRIFGYTWHALEQYHRQYPKEKLPLVYSLVVYNGKRAFNYPTDVRDLIGVPRALVDETFPNVFQLIDLNGINDEKLRQEIWSGFMLLHFKHARNRDLVNMFKNKLLRLAQHLIRTGHKEYVMSMLKYLFEATEAPMKTLAQFKDFVSNELSHDLGEQMTTLAQRLQEKGRVQGRAEGQAEGMDKMAKHIARKLLMKKSVSIEEIAAMTDLPVSVVVALQKDIKGKH